ncbi:MAG: hypothetical protein BRC38_12845 [Cyanobacteria bacterium QH_6_48_35]|nr:MAG: hypothetical protein BRC35_12875 [Cyanobacteria bacterium QH_10_48_56]PSO63808.1 MAG: hypothetical protein BRC38_12845 [Cyanobacteria bacterium QH_6_48_35]
MSTYHAFSEIILGLLYQVVGKQTHDSRLVAAIIVHQIDYLLTFNTKDFQRFSEMTAITPLNISP